MTPEEVAAAQQAANDATKKDDAAPEPAAAAKPVPVAKPAATAKPAPAPTVAAAPVPSVKPVFSGRPGGAFGVDGEGFGPAGTLSVGGQIVATTRWTDKNIRGTLPGFITGGEVVIQSAGGTKQTCKTSFK